MDKHGKICFYVCAYTILLYNYMNYKKKIGRGGRMTALSISVDTLLATTSKITDDLTFSGKYTKFSW